MPEQSVIRIVHTNRNGMPIAPPEIRDAVELFARKSGRSGVMHFFPPGGWFARLSYRASDPVMRMVQEQGGEAGGEDVFFHVPNVFDGRIMSLKDVQADSRYKNLPLIDWWGGNKGRMGGFLQLDVLQLGASGVTSYLDREDTWSGRGEFGSLTEGVRKQREKNETGKERYRESLEENAGRRAKDLRRRILKIPYLGVLIGKSRPGNRKET